MAERILLKQPEPAVPKEIQELLGERHLVLGEKPELYDALCSRIASVVQPKDIIEWFWVKDITDLLWEIQRLRRHKAAIINDGRKGALRELLWIAIDDGNVPSERADRLAHDFISGNAKTKAKLQALLTEHNFDEHSVASKSFEQAIETLETIERLIAAAELRRDRILREVEFHRETLGRRMREAIEAEGKKPALLESTKKDTGSSVHN